MSPSTEKLSPITEHEFKLVTRVNTVTSVVVKEESEGFTLRLQMVDSQETLILTTKKKTPRVWSNLNVLIDFLKKNGVDLPSLTLVLLHK